MVILGITPARGGSKGIPRKNIKLLAGKPLIAWTIEAAHKSKSLDKYIVSTEDKEIADISRKYGAHVLERPSKLSTDEATTLSVLQYAVKLVPCDIVVLLQATSPVRKPELIDDCIKEFIDQQYDSLATGFICKYTEYGVKEQRRQDIPGFFYDDGNVYVMKADLIMKGDRYGNNIGRKIITKQENIDIDDEIDFWIAEKIILEKAYTANEKKNQDQP